MDWINLFGENEKVFTNNLNKTSAWDLEASIKLNVKKRKKKNINEVVRESRVRIPEDKRTWWSDKKAQDMISNKKDNLK